MSTTKTTATTKTTTAIVPVTFNTLDLTEMLRVENKFKKTAILIDELKTRLANAVKIASAKTQTDSTKTHVSYGYFLMRKNNSMFHITYNEQRAKGNFWQMFETNEKGKVISQSEQVKTIAELVERVKKIPNIEAK